MRDRAGNDNLRGVIKPINFRPMLFCALSVIVGIILFRYYPTLKAWTVIIPLATALAISVLLWFTIENEKRFSAIATVCFCCLFALIGIFSFGIYLKRVENTQIEAGSYTVLGEVGEVEYYEDRYIFTLKNCTYDGEEGGDLYVNGYPYEINLYGLVEIKCYVRPSYLFNDGKISNEIVRGRVMVAEKVYSYREIGTAEHIASKFKAKTDGVFLSVFGSHSGIFSALIRGDVSEMKGEVDPFRVVGIAHIFAVSGMHVGLIYAALIFIFRKIPVNKLIKLVLTCGILIFYSYLCGFTPSSVRAVITCSCLAVCSAFGEKYDAVNALSVAFIIITLLSPVELFSVGLILSFTVSFSITVLSPPIKRVLSFLPEAFSESLGVLISAQLAAIPLSVTYFGSFPMISFFANFILLPLATIVYYLTVIGVVLTLILPIIGPIALFLPKILILGVQGISELLANTFFVIEVFPEWLKLVYYTALILASDLINLPKFFKVCCFTVVIVGVTVTFMVTNLTNLPLIA